MNTLKLYELKGVFSRYGHSTMTLSTISVQSTVFVLFVFNENKSNKFCELVRFLHFRLLAKITDRIIFSVFLNEQLLKAGQLLDKHLSFQSYRHKMYQNKQVNGGFVKLSIHRYRNGINFSKGVLMKSTIL